MPRGASFLNLLPDASWLSLWVQWDSEWYLDVAIDGYSFEAGQPSNTAFFPLYPLLVRIGALLAGRLDIETAAVVGLAISNVSLFVALLYLRALVARDLGTSVARRAVLYVLVAPATVFLSAAYAESLFLATAVGSLYHARRGEWYRAGIAGCLAALTRPFGLLLVVPIAIEMFRQRARLRSLPALLLAPAGTAAFFAYLWWALGSPWLYVDANAVWDRQSAWPWEPLLEFTRNPVVVFGWYYSLVDLAFVVSMCVLAGLAWRRLPMSYAAFATAGLLLTLSTKVWISTPRHSLALFPLVVVLAVYGERRAVHWAWLTLSVLLAIAFMARFASGNWTA